MNKTNIFLLACCLICSYACTSQPQSTTGIPVVVGVGTSLVLASMLTAGGASILYGFASSILASKLGSTIDKKVFGNVKEKGNPKTIKGEFASNGWKKNNIKHVAGVISIARATDKNSASSQFFICSATSEHLDGEYAAFGKTSDSASKQVVIEISKVKTHQYSKVFTDMPINVVRIKNIKLSNTKF